MDRDLDHFVVTPLSSVPAVPVIPWLVLAGIFGGAVVLRVLGGRLARPLRIAAVSVLALLVCGQALLFGLYVYSWRWQVTFAETGGTATFRDMTPGWMAEPIWPGLMFAAICVAAVALIANGPGGLK